MVSLDTPMEDQAYGTLGNQIASNFDLEAEIFKESNVFVEERIEAYFDQLSEVQ